MQLRDVSTSREKSDVRRPVSDPCRQSVRPQRFPAGSLGAPMQDRGTMSPTAYRPSTDARSRSSVTTNPLSRLIPFSAKPLPSVRGPRPTATNSRSVSNIVPSPSSTRTRIGCFFRGSNLCVCLTDDSTFPVCPLQLLRRPRILGGDQSGECLDDRYFGAERAPEACELDADDTATEYRCAGGHPVEFECLVAGDDPSAEFDAGEFPRIRAGGQNE